MSLCHLHSHEVIVLREISVPHLNVEHGAVIVHAQVKSLQPLWVQSLILSLTFVLLRPQLELAVRVAKSCKKITS